MQLAEHGSFFGRLTSEANPVSYLIALRQLFTDFCREAKTVELDDGSEIPVPLLVNTPGWVKVRALASLTGLAETLLASLYLNAAGQGIRACSSQSVPTLYSSWMWMQKSPF